MVSGAVIHVACKFAFEGGMSVTKVFKYTVGTDCLNTGVKIIKDSELFFYPNPVQDVIHITLPQEKSRIMIFDIIGNRVYDEINSYNSDIDVSFLTAGLYLITVENSQGVRSSKFTK